MQLHNLTITLSTITRLPAPPRVPADLFRLADECDSGLSPQAVHCIETAARSERKRDAAARKSFLSRLIQSTLKECSNLLFGYCRKGVTKEKTMPSKNLSPFARATLSDRFHFGWCNACERYACGQSAEEIMATPTRESSAVTEREARAVTAGVHAALAVLSEGLVEGARRTAIEYGVKGKSLDDLVALALDS